jgi:hypothetical protein
LKTTASVGTVLLLLAGAVAGCHGAGWSELGSGSSRDESRSASRSESQPKQQSTSSRQDKEELQLVARSNREVARTLSSDDIVKIMQRVGFSDRQILDLGTDLYNALRRSGAADVYYGKSHEMIFAVNNQQVQIQSRSRGTFVYDLAKGRFVVGATSEDRGR